MKYHYVYIITNKINHKFYIGKHSTDDLDDGYLGSGTVINKAIQKYGIENFSKRILCFCDSAEDAYKVEEFLVTDNLIKREDCYNIAVGGQGGALFKNHHHTEETRLKMSEAKKGKPFSEEHKRKLKIARQKRVITLETRNKMKDIMIGRVITWKDKIRKPKPKFKWLTPTGEIKTMDKIHAHRYHPDWVMVEQ